jgi:hypothetical protein
MFAIRAGSTYEWEKAKTAAKAAVEGMFKLRVHSIPPESSTT